MDGFLEFLLYSFGGLRFLFSPTFRQKTLERWRTQRQMQTMQEIVGTLAGFLLLLLLPLLAWSRLS